MQGVPEQFFDERDSARFRHLAQLPGVELYHAHISCYAFGPHTHEAFGIGAIEAGAERFRYRGTQYVAPVHSVVTMNPDELHTGEAESAELDAKLAAGVVTIPYGPPEIVPLFTITASAVVTTIASCASPRIKPALSTISGPWFERIAVPLAMISPSS